MRILIVPSSIYRLDIKPSNILLNKCGAVKVCDFGICGYLQDSVAQTREAGCRPYMAVTIQINCLSVVSARKTKSNIPKLWYSIGCLELRSNIGLCNRIFVTLYIQIEVANFSFPYSGFNEAPVFSQLQMVVHEDPPMIINTNYSTRLRNFTNMW